MLSEKEMIINSKPLNTFDMDNEEIYEIMTPNHLLFRQKLHKKTSVGKVIQISLS